MIRPGSRVKGKRGGRFAAALTITEQANPENWTTSRPDGHVQAEVGGMAGEGAPATAVSRALRSQNRAQAAQFLMPTVSSG